MRGDETQIKYELSLKLFSHFPGCVGADEHHRGDKFAEERRSVKSKTIIGNDAENKDETLYLSDRPLARSSTRIPAFSIDPSYPRNLNLTRGMINEYVPEISSMNPFF